MDTDVVKAFNAELTSIYDSKPPLGKNKIQDISKAALKAKGYYKHVVFSVEKFLSKCKPEYKIPVLYVVDSIIRASKHQLKDKDVYAPRFLKNFSKTLADLLSCGNHEKPRIVRTLNLWSANGVFTEEEMAPLKQQCRDAGLETDVEKVEKLVKGGTADLSIYGGAYAKKEKKHHHHKRSEAVKFEATTPPGPPPPSALREAAALNGGASEKEMPSDEVPEGGISERQLLKIIQDAGCDFGGSFSSDLTLLRKAHEHICNRLRMEEEMKKERKKANIKTLLTNDFNYSDDEDSGDEGVKKEVEEEEEAPRPMTLEERVGLTDQLVREPAVTNALKVIHQERILQLNQVAIQAQQQNNIPATVAAPNLTDIQPTVSNPLAAIPASLASSIPGGIPGIPHGFQIPPPGMGALGNIHGLAGLQLPPGMPNPMVAGAHPNQNALLGLLGNPLNIPGMPALVRQPGLNLSLLGNGLQGDADLIKKQQAEIMKQVYLGQPIAVPPPALPSALAGGQQPLSQGMMPSGMPLMSSDEDFRALANQQEEDRDRRRKRSRSKDRGEHKKSRRSRSRERKTEKLDRERRKLGLPALTPGFTMIASKTLWFGRLPANCSEREINTAIASAGEVRRINIIQSKACAYVTMDTRKNAFDVVTKLGRDLRIKDRNVRVNWAVGNGLKEEKYKSMFDGDKGVTVISWNMLPENLETLCDGGHLDVESLPPEKQGRFTEDGIPCEMSVATGSQDDVKMEVCSPSPHAPVIMANTSIDSSNGSQGNVQPNIQNIFMMPPGVPTNLLPPGLPPQHMAQLLRMPPPGGHQIPVLGIQQTNMPGANIPNQHSAMQLAGLVASDVSPQKQTAFDLAPSHFQGRGGFRGGFRGRAGFGGDRGGFRGGGDGERRWGADRPPREDFRRPEPDRDFRGDGAAGDFRGPTSDYRRNAPGGGDFNDRRRSFDREDRGQRRDFGGPRDRGDDRRRDFGRDDRRRSRWGDRDVEGGNSWERSDNRDRRDRSRQDRDKERDRDGRRDRERDRRRSERESPRNGDRQSYEGTQEQFRMNDQDEIPPGTGPDDAVVTSTTADLEPPGIQTNNCPPAENDCLPAVEHCEPTDFELPPPEC